MKLLERKLGTRGNSACVTIPKNLAKEYEKEGRLIILLVKEHEVKIDGFRL